MRPDAPQPQFVRTTQRTGKLWKLIQLVGVALLLIGLVLIVGQTDQTAGILSVVAGLPVLLIGKIGAWWFHG